MWIIIKGVRYNFNRLGFYYAVGKNVFLVDAALDRAEEINIICESPMKANELIEQIDNRTGAQTL